MASKENQTPAAAKKPLKFEKGNFDTDADLTADRVIGFVKIEDLGDAVQTKFSIATLLRVMPILKEMDKAGYDAVYVTLAKDEPIVFGGKKIGIAIAPRIETDSY